MSKSILQRIFKVLAWTMGIVFFFLMVIFTRVDRRPYQQMDYYQSTMSHLDSMNWKHGQSTYWKAGWAKVNATPKDPVNLAGYNPRGKYEFVQDSSFLRAILLSNGDINVAFVNFELMIIHPYLEKRIQKRIHDEGLKIDMLYFTATHTHSGMGGYMPGLIGKFAFGGYDEELMSLLEKKSIQVLKTAYSNLDTAKIVFQKAYTKDLVANRLIENDPIDPFVRQLTFINTKGQKATLLSYSAHSTILNRKFMGLSGDYPHYLCQKLEEEYDLAMFMAGTVGSHKPVIKGKEIEDVIHYSEEVFASINKNLIDSDTLENKGSISYYTMPLHLRKAHFRIGKNIRIRPWLFKLLVGDSNAHFDMVLIGNTLLISSSGEISGVFMEKWEKYARDNGLHLLVSCFNGGYIGYITPDQYYDEKLYEVRDMNWYGPYNGAYFDEIIMKIIEKASRN
ncbi:neutral/alkaline non-lysosomal ceramidase N-terminal domain-containing protein [Cecembia rubra]|nr:neutral/alkaline non-lysosomal ceramidase N-terminal domain-containing protein [Cecembia rubra]